MVSWYLLLFSTVVHLLLFVIVSVVLAFLTLILIVPLTFLWSLPIVNRFNTVTSCTCLFLSIIKKSISFFVFRSRLLHVYFRCLAFIKKVFIAYRPCFRRDCIRVLLLLFLSPIPCCPKENSLSCFLLTFTLHSPLHEREICWNFR